MSDRELLELAAKAAGIRIDYSDTNGGGRFNAGFDLIGNAVLDWHNGHTWNPFADDGDALRLAADLDLFGSPSYWHWLAIARLENSVDKHANVRRAIVRAAADIGATQPSKDGDNHE